MGVRDLSKLGRKGGYIPRGVGKSKDLVSPVE